MRMLTVQYKQFARKNFMHNADQTMNSHTENFMRSKMYCSLEEIGTTKIWRLVDRASGFTRILGNLQVDNLVSSMRGFGGVSTRVHPLIRK